MNQQLAATPTFGHAIVIGNSMAGLAAARVLLNHFEKVTVIERDHLPTGNEFRKGTPQARHPHALLARGQMILEELFPGLVAELYAQGAVNANMGRDVVWSLLGQWRPRFDSTLDSTALSRPLLEGTVRRRLLAEERIHLIQAHEVTGLLTDESRSRVTGVTMRPVGQGERIEREVQADFVLDASGRGSRAPAWLEAHGYAAPRETLIDGKAAYASRVYRRPENWSGWQFLYIQPSVGFSKRGVLFLPMEGNCWQVTLIGMMGDYPPTDEEGFLEFARSLSSPIAYETLKHAEPVSEIHGYRRAENRLRHYNELPRYLDGFVAMGDSVFAFNPVYGQGMTVAAMGSQVLDRCLAEQQRTKGGDLTGFAARFQKELAGSLTGPWQLATGEDKNWIASESGAAQPLGDRIMAAFMGKVMRASLVSPKIADTFYRVMNMLDAPTVFFRPDMLWEIFTARQPAATAAPAHPTPMRERAMAAD